MDKVKGSSRLQRVKLLMNERLLTINSWEDGIINYPFINYPYEIVGKMALLTTLMIVGTM